MAEQIKAMKILVPASLHAAIKTYAAAKRRRMNETIVAILEDHVRGIPCMKTFLDELAEEAGQ